MSANDSVATRVREVTDDRPPRSRDLKVISIGSSSTRTTGHVRGPSCTALRAVLSDVHWGDLDTIVVGQRRAGRRAICSVSCFRGRSSVVTTTQATAPGRVRGRAMAVKTTSLRGVVEKCPTWRDGRSLRIGAATLRGRDRSRARQDPFASLALLDRGEPMVLGAERRARGDSRARRGDRGNRARASAWDRQALPLGSA